MVFFFNGIHFIALSVSASSEVRRLPDVGGSSLPERVDHRHPRNLISMLHILGLDMRAPGRFRRSQDQGVPYGKRSHPHDFRRPVNVPHFDGHDFASFTIPSHPALIGIHAAPFPGVAPDPNLPGQRITQLLPFRILPLLGAQRSLRQHFSISTFSSSSPPGRGQNSSWFSLTRCRGHRALGDPRRAAIGTAGVRAVLPSHRPGAHQIHAA